MNPICEKKNTFLDKQIALDFSKEQFRIGGNMTVPYECNFCGKIHLTGKNETVRKFLLRHWDWKLLTKSELKERVR